MDNLIKVNHPPRTLRTHIDIHALWNSRRSCHIRSETSKCFGRATANSARQQWEHVQFFPSHSFSTHPTDTALVGLVPQQPLEELRPAVLLWLFWYDSIANMISLSAHFSLSSASSQPSRSRSQTSSGRVSKWCRRVAFIPQHHHICVHERASPRRPTETGTPIWCDYECVEIQSIVSISAKEANTNMCTTCALLGMKFGPNKLV